MAPEKTSLGPKYKLTMIKPLAVLKGSDCPCVVLSGSNL